MARYGSVPLHNRHRAVDISAADFDLPSTTVAVVVTGTVNDLVLQDRNGTNFTYPSAFVTLRGGVIEGRWQKVIKTGTSAAGIVAWFWDPMK
jgi:hypothetical protein